MAAHAQQFRQVVQKDTADPGRHAVMSRCGAMMDVNSKDGDDNGKGHKDHSENQIFSNERNHLGQKTT